MSKRIVKNYPSPRLMQTIGATNQLPSEAIGELVANSFDARVGDERLNVVVAIGPDEVSVIDDGKGMTGPILEKAVCIAEDMSLHLDRGDDAKGHYGMGFKTSCATLGRFYEIYTRPVECETELHVAFDVTSYASRPSGEDAWDVEIEEERRMTGSPLGDAPHGTAFIVKRLNSKEILVSAVLEHLSEAFKGHLLSGDTIAIVDAQGNRFQAQPKKRKYVPGTRVPIDVTCGPGGALHIKGWVALDDKTHNDGNYGFNIYRRGQLVDSWNKDWFKKHLMTSRVFGEVHMDFLESTFYKQGLQESESWIIASKAMSEFLKPIVAASREISRKGNISNSVKRNEIVAKMQGEYDLTDREVTPSIQNVQETEAGDLIDTSNPEPLTMNEVVKTCISCDELRLQNGLHIPISFLETPWKGVSNAPFDLIYDDGLEDEPELQAILYTGHPLWSGKEDEGTLRVLAIADAIFRVLVDQIGMTPSEAFQVKNDWIMTNVGKEAKRHG